MTSMQVDGGWGDEVGCVVLDLGSDTLKAGYAGDDCPKCVIPSAVGVQYSSGNVSQVGANGAVGEEGTPSSAASENVRKQVNYFAGTEQLMVRRDSLEVRRATTDGLISDWDAVEQLWQHAMNQRLRVNPRERPILLAEPSFNTRAVRERWTELLFEKYEIPALFISKNAVLSAFANGKANGLVLDSGGDTTSATPVFEGYVLQESIQRSNVGGHRITQEYLKFLEEKDITINPQFAVKKQNIGPGRFKVAVREFPETHPSYHAYCVTELVEDLKKSVCKVSDIVFDAAAHATIPTIPYELPDGTIVHAGPERFEIVEMMFSSKKQGAEMMDISADGATSSATGAGKDNDHTSFQSLIYNSVSSCDADVRRELFSNIIVSGGNSLIEGFSERLNYELQPLAPSFKVKFVGGYSPSIEKRFSVWIGGSILASLGSFQQMWMSKAEYEERGKSLVERKCP